MSTIHTTAAYLMEMENDYDNDIREYELSLVERDERFKREIINSIFTHLDNFSRSIEYLANSISEQKPPTVINLIVDKETDVSKIKDIVNIIG